MQRRNARKRKRAPDQMGSNGYNDRWQASSRALDVIVLMTSFKQHDRLNTPRPCKISLYPAKSIAVMLIFHPPRCFKHCGLVMQAMEDTLCQQQGRRKRWLWCYDIQIAEEVKVSSIHKLQLSRVWEKNGPVSIRRRWRERSCFHLCCSTSGKSDSRIG